MRLRSALNRADDFLGRDNVISRPDPHGWFQAPPPVWPYTDELGHDPGRLRVGLLLDAPTGLPVDPDCVTAATRLADLLERMGHDVHPVAPVMLTAEAAAAYVEIIMSASLYAPGYDNPELAEPYNRYRWERLRICHAGQYVQVTALLQAELRQIVAQWGRDFDVLLTPRMACTPPRLGTVIRYTPAATSNTPGASSPTSRHPYLPHDFPPYKTVYAYFSRWAADGTTEKIHDLLARQGAASSRPRSGAHRCDHRLQSVKTSTNVPEGSQGIDAGKKIKAESGIWPPTRSACSSS